MGTNPKDLIGTKKPPLGLVPTAGIIHEAMAMKDGAKKYGPYNWRENGKAVRYTVYHNAALRHIYAAFDGEECAPDSGADHLGHARACLGIILDARECGMLIDDRPEPGATSKLLEKFTEQEPVREMPPLETVLTGMPEEAVQALEELRNKHWDADRKGFWNTAGDQTIPENREKPDYDGPCFGGPGCCCEGKKDGGKGWHSSGK